MIVVSQSSGCQDTNLPHNTMQHQRRKKASGSMKYRKFLGGQGDSYFLDGNLINESGSVIS